MWLFAVHITPGAMADPACRVKCTNARAFSCPERPSLWPTTVRRLGPIEQNEICGAADQTRPAQANHISPTLSAPCCAPLLRPIEVP